MNNAIFYVQFGNGDLKRYEIPENILQFLIGNRVRESKPVHKHQRVIPFTTKMFVAQHMMGTRSVVSIKDIRNKTGYCSEYVRQIFREMMKDGLVEPVRIAPNRHNYRLTAKGRKLTVPNVMDDRTEIVREDSPLGVSQKARNFIVRLLRRANHRTLTITEMSARSGYSKSHVSRIVRQLKDEGYVEMCGSGYNTAYKITAKGMTDTP